MFYNPIPSDASHLTAFRTVAFKDRFLARLYDTARYWFIVIVSNYLFLFILAIGWPSHFPFSWILATLLAMGWYLFRDGMKGGSSFGKDDRGLIVICTDTLVECTYFRSFIRNIITDVSAVAIFFQLAGNIPISLIYVFVLAIDCWRIIKSPGGRRAGDILAGTQVLYVDDWIKYKQEVRNRAKQISPGTDGPCATRELRKELDRPIENVDAHKSPPNSAKSVPTLKSKHQVMPPKISQNDAVNSEKISEVVAWFIENESDLNARGLSPIIEMLFKLGIEPMERYDLALACKMSDVEDFKNFSLVVRLTNSIESRFRAIKGKDGTIAKEAFTLVLREIDNSLRDFVKSVRQFDPSGVELGEFIDKLNRILDPFRNPRPITYLATAFNIEMLRKEIGELISSSRDNSFLMTVIVSKTYLDIMIYVLGWFYFCWFDEEFTSPPLGPIA
jgi:hypothetical protein